MLFRDIITTFEKDVASFERGGDLSPQLFAKLCEYYEDEIIDIPDYELQEWVADRFQADIE